MNVHSRMIGLLLLSVLLFPNVAWCWDNDDDYYNNYYNHDRNSSNYDSRDRNNKPKETPQEYQYRKLGEYNQAKVDQQVETARQQAEYQQEKYRMDAEAQLRSLQK